MRWSCPSPQAFIQQVPTSRQVRAYRHPGRPAQENLSTALGRASCGVLHPDSAFPGKYGSYLAWGQLARCTVIFPLKPEPSMHRYAYWSARCCFQNTLEDRVRMSACATTARHDGGVGKRLVWLSIATQRLGWSWDIRWIVLITQTGAKSSPARGVEMRRYPRLPGDAWAI